MLYSLIRAAYARSPVNERLKRQWHQPWIGGGVGALLATVVGLIFFLLPPGKGLRDWSFDLPFLFKAEQQISDAAIVYLDEKSYNELKQDPTRFDRALHAKLVRRLQQAGAKLVVFDVLFIDSSRGITAAELDFAAAMKESRRVVLGAQYFEDTHLAASSTSVWPPVDLFREAAAGWGLVRVHRDTDFAARRISPGTDQIPCMAWKAAELTGAQIAKQPEARLTERWLNYYCREPFAAISYSDVVSEKPLPPGFSFKDKVVFEIGRASCRERV